MKLISFRIRHYKSIVDSRECEMSLENISILAGQNESGKTSILEGLRDFDYNVEINPEARPDDNEEATPEIECTFTVDEEDLDQLEDDNDKPLGLSEKVKKYLAATAKVVIRKSFPNEYTFVDEDLNQLLLEEQATAMAAKEGETTEAAAKSSEDPAAIAAEKKEKKKTYAEVLVGALVRRSPYIVYFDSFDGRLPRKKYVAEIDNEKEAGYQAVQDFLKLAEIDVERLTSAGIDTKQLSNYLESKSAKVTGDFLNYWSQKYDGVNHVEIVTELNRDDKGPFLNFYVKDQRVRKYPDQRSKGFLWFLSFYLRLNAEKLEKDDLGAVILIDEPGSYLHPRAQKDILKILKERIAKEKNQVVFSTHSSDLIDPDRLNRVRIVLNRKGKGTMIYKISDPEPRQNGETEFADALSPIISAIGKDLGRDFSVAAKKNVLVEGISDYYYLTTLREKTGFKIPADIKIIPLTGALSINRMVSVMIGWGLEYAVVMDRDEISNAEFKKLTEELDVPAKAIFQIEGGKAIEDLFSARDFKRHVLGNERATIPANMHQSDHIRNEKVILSRGFNEKYKDSTLALEEETKQKFKKIFDFIRGAFVKEE